MSGIEVMGMEYELASEIRRNGEGESEREKVVDRVRGRQRDVEVFG